MNRLIKTAAIAAFGWACYRFGDYKGSLCTAAFLIKDTPKDLKYTLSAHVHEPLWINAACAKAVEKYNNKLHEPDTEATEEAD